MEQEFLEVFKNLNFKSSLKTMFEDVTLVKLIVAKEKGVVKIFIRSTHLISRKDKAQMEREIKEQMFKETPFSVKLMEEYDLPANYTPIMLLEEYRDSMLYELSERSKILESCFSKIEFEEIDAVTVKVLIPDREIFRGREGEIISYLVAVVQDRCKLESAFKVEYVEVEEDTEKEAWDEYRVQQLVNARLGNRMAQNGESNIPDNMQNEATGQTGALGIQSKTDISTEAGADNLTQNTADANSESKASDVKPDIKQNKAETKKPEEKKAFNRDAKFTKDSKFSGKKEFKTYARRDDYGIPDNPDVYWGREFDPEEPHIPISDVVEDFAPVVINGKIIITDRRDLRSGKSILFLTVTDYTDTIKIKVFLKTEMYEEYEARLEKGKWVRIKGIISMDTFEHELSMSSPQGIMKGVNTTVKRKDLSPEKRVELHCHTKMSDMDGVSDVKDIVNCAYEWGHKAIAITDHGVVQGFTEANHTWEALYEKACKSAKEAGTPKPDKQDFFKVIYGVEGYLVDDLLETVIDSRGQSLSSSFVVFDIETTGFSATKNKIIEIGAVKIVNGEIVGRFSEFVNPGVPIPFRITKLTSITDAMVKDADPIEMVLPEFMAFCMDSVLVAHNAGFDTSFIKENCKQQGLPYDCSAIDTLPMARCFLPGLSRYTLDAVAKELNVSLENHHRAVDDAECTAHIFKKLLKMCDEKGITNLDELAASAEIPAETIRGMNSHHVIILAKNNIGRINLYTLVSKSHLEYFSSARNRVPKIPKSEVMKHREGLIIGSACEAGELYQAIIDERSEDQIARIVNFYDYLEIQPRGNNAFMVKDTTHEKYEKFQTEEDILEVNKEIVKLGELYNKPVVATCDVHFLNPEDELYRRIIMTGQGFTDADDQAPLYLHTTDEMLEEFGYLGSKKAREVVITNPNAIADSVDSITPVRPDKCAPVIENSDETLTNICYNKAHEMYGENLPEIVKERLERELNSIIKNGFAVMYIIAQKLVWKSVEDGYLVGSRGSVGSSFVATMSGITEVNPLVPHYYCSKCHFYDFDSEEVKKFRGMAGVDMPDRVCPVCGENLKKDGFDIPFETFLGFKGDKEPDIDLNFSGEYQSKAHRYTEVIFGAGQTFRAGTIASLADKTAFGYVKKYFEEKGIHKRDCEIDRIVGGCVGVRRSTGQHPGGIIVLPVGEDINSFTPVQHPANDTTTDTITTHFDYHSIDHNLLKLDILGHDDPTMIRMLQDLTGIDPLDIPLDDPKVMSLFESTEALGVAPADIGGCEIGCLGVPEFGTDFSMGMVQEAKPKYFSDLIRIAGLSHGTDVWLNNAQDLIRDGIATISTAICTRDDIMTYLINKGVDSAESFKIMEMVRKGKVAGGKCKEWPQWKEDMRACDVPEWYIESCEKIKYMFPRAHAAAYVMMAWRIAYCKVYYPLAYYAAFFSIRAKAFNYETMCFGRDRLEEELKRLKNLEKPTPKDEDSIRDLRIVREMYARGYEFMPIDLFRAKAKLFSIVDGKIMPSFTSIEGLGDNAADSIVEAAKKGAFISKDDFRSRSKVSQTVADDMARLGILGDIPESNQISLFDLFKE
ncbi:MAG: PolC-type DNA polymerase III [Lachnospiraceae bacterium]|nr:PolC-type DNA polymerase III [Lachnospiraceae bacterium]